MNDLEVAVEHAVLTGQIRSLVAWVGSGRKTRRTFHPASFDLAEASARASTA